MTACPHACSIAHGPWYPSWYQPYNVLGTSRGMRGMYCLLCMLCGRAFLLCPEPQGPTCRWQCKATRIGLLDPCKVIMAGLHEAAVHIGIGRRMRHGPSAWAIRSTHHHPPSPTPTSILLLQRYAAMLVAAMSLLLAAAPRCIGRAFLGRTPDLRLLVKR